MPSPIRQLLHGLSELGFERCAITPASYDGSRPFERVGALDKTHMVAKQTDRDLAIGGRAKTTRSRLARSTSRASATSDHIKSPSNSGSWRAPSTRPSVSPRPCPDQASAVVFILQARSSGAGGLTIYPADVATAPTALRTSSGPTSWPPARSPHKLGVGVGGSGGKIKILNRANTPTDVILDVTGFYS